MSGIGRFVKYRLVLLTHWTSHNTRKVNELSIGLQNRKTSSFHVNLISNDDKENVSISIHTAMLANPIKSMPLRIDYLIHLYQYKYQVNNRNK